MFWFRILFFATFLLPMTVLASSGLRTCEDVFSGQTVVGRAIQQRLIQNLLRKQTPASRAEKVASATPPKVVETAVPAARTYRLPSVAMSMEKIRWVSDTSLLLSKDYLEAEIPASRRTRSFLDALIVDTDSGRVLESLVPWGKIATPTSVLRVVEKGNHGVDTYRFLDSKTLSEVRPAIESSIPISMQGNFIAATEANGRSFLTSLSPSDFGAHETREVDRELPRGYTHLEGVGGNEAETVVLAAKIGGKKAFNYDSARNAYVPTRGYVNEYNARDRLGGEYHIKDVHPDILEIQKQGERLTQTVEFMGETSTKVLQVFGDGASRSLLVQQDVGMFYTEYRAVVIGLRPFLTVGITPRFRLMERVTDRYVLLSQNVTRTSPPVLWDLALARTQELSGVETRGALMTSMLDLNRYVRISVEESNPSLGYADDSGGPLHSTIRIYELGTRTLLHEVSRDGVATLIPRTKILSVETGRKIDYIDIETGEILWSGVKNFMPRISPDGSRIAYVVNGKLHVDVLGDKVESRLMY